MRTLKCADFKYLFISSTCDISYHIDVERGLQQERVIKVGKYNIKVCPRLLNNILLSESFLDRVYNRKKGMVEEIEKVTIESKSRKFKTPWKFGNSLVHKEMRNELTI